MKTKYKRVLLKLSGEALMGDQGFGIDSHIVVKLSATAMTSHRFTNNWQGAMLGWEMSPGQLAEGRLPNSATAATDVRFGGCGTRRDNAAASIIAITVADRESIISASPCASAEERHVRRPCRNARHAVARYRH